MGSGAICQNLCRRHDRFRVSEFDICVGNNIFSSKGIYGKKENNDKFTYLRLEYNNSIPTFDVTHRKNGHQWTVDDIFIPTVRTLIGRSSGIHLNTVHIVVTW